MNYYLYKLQFDGAVHFGAADSALSLSSSADHFCADTLFSALCHTAGTLWGNKGIEALCKQVDDGALLLSDSMPWRCKEDKDIYYLPKPCAVSQAKQEVPADLRKQIKRLAWIPVAEMAAFQSSLEGKALYLPQEEPLVRMKRGPWLRCVTERKPDRIKWALTALCHPAGCTFWRPVRRRNRESCWKGWCERWGRAALAERSARDMVPLLLMM